MQRMPSNLLGRASTKKFALPGARYQPTAATSTEQPEAQSGLPKSKMPVNLNAFRLSKISQSWVNKAGSEMLYRPRQPKGGKKKKSGREPGDPDWSSRLLPSRRGGCPCRADWGICCIVCWCSCIVVPQLYEREIGPPGACRKWFFRLGCLCSLNFFVVGARNVWLSATFYWWHGNWDSYSYWPDVTVGLCACALATTSMCIAVMLLKAVRQKVRTRDGIPAERCGEKWEDCWAALCCTLCVNCQLLRHLDLRWGPICCWADEDDVKHRRYTLKSPTGERAAVVADGGPEAVFDIANVL